MFFDEFAVYNRPSIFYGWAERNTRPSVPSNERQRHKLNGLLCVDALSGEEFLRLSDKAKTEDISLYLAEFCLDCIELGFDKLSIVLDNNTTHKQKMPTQLTVHLQQMGYPRVRPRFDVKSWKACESDTETRISGGRIWLQLE